MIEVKNLSFSYKNKKILSDISFSLKEGECCALLGKNGSGKTTLLRLLSKLQSADSGELCLNGKPYSSYSPREFSKNVSYFAQTRNTPQMSVYDYVSYGRYPHSGISFRLSASDKEAIERALEKTNTQDFRYRELASLSGGERHLVYLARLLAQNAPHLLLDEPTSFADAQNGFLIADILRSECREKKAILAVTHDLPLALASFDRVLVLSENSLIADTDPKTAVNVGAVERAYGVRCEKVERGYVLFK